MVLRAGFKKKLRLYVELQIYDKNRRKITGPQCVKTLFNLQIHINSDRCQQMSRTSPYNKYLITSKLGVQTEGTRDVVAAHKYPERSCR
jgi:hypothetical protein